MCARSQTAVTDATNAVLTAESPYSAGERTVT
jgi:hypothetical protein